MAVAVEEERIVLRILRDPLANLIAFLRERVVGMVVVLVAAVGAHHRSRRNDNFPLRLARRDAVLQPLFLHLAPDSLGRAVGQVIGAAVVAAFEQKDLDTAAPA